MAKKKLEPTESAAEPTPEKNESEQTKAAAEPTPKKKTLKKAGFKPFGKKGEFTAFIDDERVVLSKAEYNALPK